LRKPPEDALEAKVKRLPERVEDYMPRYGMVSEVLICVKDTLASLSKDLICPAMKL
jgi:hypothetical protein